MPINKNSTELDETSPSVQSHLAIIQTIIERMSSNSSQCKAYCITIVSAILVIIADKNNSDYAWIALIPTLLFMTLDTYYLTLEKSFRASYNQFVEKIHNGTLNPKDLYSVAPVGDMFKHRRDALKSYTIWGFYFGMALLIAIAKYAVLK